MKAEERTAHAVSRTEQRVIGCVILLLLVCSAPSIAGAATRTVIIDDQEYWEEDGVVEYAIVHGDILIPIANWDPTAKTSYDSDLWRAGVVDYDFDDNVTQYEQDMMQEAFAIIEGFTAVTFSEGIGIFDEGITIKSTSAMDCSGCDCRNNATVGATLRGRVNICNWTLRTVLHELGHVLNLHHTQSRPDRGDYVEIFEGNISQTACKGDCDHNFEIAGTAYGQYDFESLMHYRKCAFSTGGSSCPPGTETILPWGLYSRFTDTMGTGDDYSKWDRRLLSFLYHPISWKFVSVQRHNPFGANGSFLAPYSSLMEAAADVFPNGRVWMDPGTQVVDDGTVFTKPMTWRYTETDSLDSVVIVPVVLPKQP